MSDEPFSEVRGQVSGLRNIIKTLRAENAKQKETIDACLETIKMIREISCKNDQALPSEIIGSVRAAFSETFCKKCGGGNLKCHDEGEGYPDVFQCKSCDTWACETDAEYWGVRQVKP